MNYAPALDRKQSLRSLTGSTGFLVDGDWIESKDQDADGDVRLIQLADIGVGEYLNKSSRFLNLATARRLNCTFLEAGDILIARMPDPIGRACIFPGDNRRAVTVVDVCILRAAPDACDSRWLCWMLNSPEFLGQVDRLARGATRQRIPRTELERLGVVVPPLPEQRRIAAILDQADALRAKRRAALAQLDELAQAIFVEMFGGHSNDWAAWPSRHIQELCSPKQWPTITGGDLIETGYPVFGANGLIGYYSEYNHPEPTVLITCRGATCGTINISPPNCWVTGNAMALDDPPSDVININFLADVLKMRGLADAISGSAQPQITRQSLQHVRLPVPPISLQTAYADKIEAVRSLRNQGEKALVTLDSLFASLQHRAFRGEL